jgi:catechol 2,3-dioxygenase-like lactoylglutathione lyase family enzyme
MIDHTGVIVSDLAKSKAYYSAALGAMGISLLKELPASVTGRADVVGYGAKETITQGVSPEFWLVRVDRATYQCTVLSASTTALLSMHFIKPH